MRSIRRCRRCLPGTQYTSIGYAGSVPFYSRTDTQHYVEHLTFTTGKHSMKAGVDYRRSRTHRLGGFQGNGIINFNGMYTARNPTVAQTAGAANTGNGFADYLMGYASLAAGTPFDSDSGRLWNSDVNLFVQDDIRLTPQLTINVGLRWEYRGPWNEKSGGGKIFDYDYPGGRALYKDEAFVKLVNNPIFASCCFLERVQPAEYRNFAPADRHGLAAVVAEAIGWSSARVTASTTTFFTASMTRSHTRSIFLRFARAADGQRPRDATAA